MDASPYDIRLARVADLDLVKASIRRTLNNPEGRSQRKKFADAIDRGELLILVRRERGGAEEVDAFVEWHSRVDGAVTIRDAGWSGDEPNPGHVKRLLRELLRMTAPPSASVRVEADQQTWNAVFGETAGFRSEGREYSRSKWWNLWSWSPANEQVDRSREQSSRMRGPPPPIRGRR
jgi:hypothetical protein